MATILRCGTLFDGTGAAPKKDRTIVVEDGVIRWIGAATEAPPAGARDEVIDYSSSFVLPGLIDIHVHLSYGNARTEEEIDLFAPVEYRALRGLEAAQRVLRAGFTSLADPATTGRVSLSIREAVKAGLFPGPRIAAAGRQITSRQGLSDWYPSWIGVPATSIGVLVRSTVEAIEEIRLQAKDGVDFIKIAMDGDSMNPATGLIAAFTQAETDAMVAEVHRLGRKVVAHARGAEGVLYAARAKVDVILHASWMDEPGLEAVVKNGCVLCPTLSLIVNNIDFTQPTDLSYPAFQDAHKRELDAARVNLTKAKAAGVPFMLGTDCGFAVTPYGEWNARELEHYVKYLGFTPSEALRSATSVNAGFMPGGDTLGVLAKGRAADILIFDGDPLADIGLLQDRSRIRRIYLAGKPVELSLNEAVVRRPMENSYSLWGNVYTQATVARLRRSSPRAAAE